MISSLIGSVIMSAVTLAMLLALKVSDDALSEVGRYPLTKKEIQILRDAKFNSSDIEKINQVIKGLDFKE